LAAGWVTFELHSAMHELLRGRECRSWVLAV
jgi:hypothetical protein